MSKSPSPTPPTNNPPADIKTPTSRLQQYEQTPSLSQQPTPSSSRTRPRTSDPEDESPMAKRMRRDSPDRGSDRSSPSSESQDGDLADTEGPGRNENTKTPQTVMPKKKRTRTLTTPHQSAVLQALLSQSRFPTTAMREEVGRAIGLSARKVQIWFQNQRQKARRPRIETAESPSTIRPSQFGSFSNAPEMQHTNLYPQEQPQHIRVSLPAPVLEGDNRPRYDQSAAPLLGPGIPEYNPSMGLSEVSLLSGPMHSIGYPRAYGRSPSPGRRLPPLLQGPSMSTYATHHRDPSRTLPPLVFPPPSQQAIPSSIRSAPVTMPPPFPFQRRSLSPEILSHRSPQPRLPGSTAIPPPFTLQPQPQWDDPIFNSVPQYAASGWSPSGSFPRGSLSPTATQPNDMEAIPVDTSGLRSRSPNVRGGRYDPIRGSVVPFRSSTPPQSPKPDF